MSLELQIALAAALDLALGDPVWRLHPTRVIGGFILRLEEISRRVIKDEKAAGVATVIATLVVVYAAVTLAIGAAKAASPALGAVVSVFIIYTTLSARDLADHAMAVFRRLTQGDLNSARLLVGRIVGRDTALLDEVNVARAATESVAENTVDGVAAPLIFAFALGPAGAMLYKTINTMDSTFGYKNERYINFGWAAARLDDAASYIPAHIAVLLVTAAAAITGLDYRASFRLALRDGINHPSPNSGWPEAGFAGALGVQLGGESAYQGKPKYMPLIGEPKEKLEARHIKSAVALMYATLFVTFVMSAAVSYIF